jgi:long-chain acyl-CoA synthetase
MYLTQFLHRHAQGRRDTTALVCGDIRRTYGELAERVAKLAAGTRELGVTPGDRVAVLSHNSIGGIEAFLASWWIGAVACPVNTRWSVPEIADSFDDCTPCVLIADAAHANIAFTLRERVPSLRHVIHLDSRDGAEGLSATTLIERSDPIDDGRFHGDHLAALLYTGGTTGRAKGVMLTHQNVWSAAMCRLADMPPFAESVCLLSTPVFHVAGLVRVLPNLVAGGACVILPQFRADEAIAIIERERVTDGGLVPTMLQAMLDHESFAPERLRSLVRIAYGAAPSAQALITRATRLLPWAGFYQYYGMTESCAMGTMSQPSDHTTAGWSDGRATSAGHACSVIELRVVDERGADVGVNEVGEIVLRGPSVMPGYWQRPEETAHALRDGWLHTGDAGSLSEAGYLTIVDRVKDMIVTGGENVYSAEVENALAQHPAVSMCAVIGVPSERWGEAVHAAVVLRAGATADEIALREHCRGLLANYKCPKSIEFVAALPLTATGKIAKNVLREPHWRGYTRKVN